MRGLVSGAKMEKKRKGENKLIEASAYKFALKVPRMCTERSLDFTERSLNFSTRGEHRTERAREGVRGETLVHCEREIDQKGAGANQSGGADQEGGQK
jgi:hypothetical protein